MAGEVRNARLIDYFFVGGLGQDSLEGKDERSVRLNDAGYVLFSLPAVAFVCSISLDPALSHVW